VCSRWLSLALMTSKAGLRFSNLLTRLLVLAMLFQCAGFNVGSKTLNMVGGGGINSPHPPTSRYQQSSAHGRTGLSGAHCTVRCTVRCATKIPVGNLALSGFFVGNSSPGPAWPHLAEGALDSLVPQGQKPHFLIYVVFQIGFGSILSVCSRVSHYM
jgi:hypothetical protein